MSGAVLPRSFYDRSTEMVARDLLGKVIVHRIGGRTLSGRIVECEAYLGGDDQAAHSYAGRTERTKVIFGPPGRAYVYLSYGIHHCLNLIAEAGGTPGCVLIRAVEPVEGIAEMRRRRGAKRDREIASGPGKLTQAMGITLEHYGADVTRGRLTVRDAPAPSSIVVGPRIGITKSVELPLRFLIADNEHVSR